MGSIEVSKINVVHEGEDKKSTKDDGYIPSLPSMPEYKPFTPTELPAFLPVSPEISPYEPTAPMGPFMPKKTPFLLQNQRENLCPSP